jgi:hypothetical protein
VVLAADRLIVVRIGEFQVHSETSLYGVSTDLSLSPDGRDAWVLHDDGFVTRIDTSDWQVIGTEDTGLSQAAGMAISTDGTSLFTGNNADSTVCRLSLPDLQVVASSETWNPVTGVYDGPEGLFSGTVEGSNEIWFWDEVSCELDYMITVPEEPVCAASMTDGSFVFAGVPGTGLVVASRSGEHAMVTPDYGTPTHMAIGPDGRNAIMCSPAEMSITILEE